MLLIHQLNTGNLSPSQIDWACSQLRAWSRKLVLDAVPRSPEGFFVDLAGAAGLVRRTGTGRGLDAALRRHHAARRLARARDRRAARARRPPTRARAPRSTSSASRSSRRCGRPSRRTSTTTCGAIRAWPARSRPRCASGSRGSAASSRSRTPRGGRRCRCGGRADRGVRGRRRAAHPPPRARRARFARGEPLVAVGPDVAGEGSQRRGAAHRRVRRHRRLARAGRAGRDPPVRDARLGAGRRAAPQQALDRGRRGRRVDHRRPRRARRPATRSASRRTISASSSTGSTSRRSARASTASTCRRRRARTSRCR